jgi:hypothetical protein
VTSAAGQNFKVHTQDLTLLSAPHSQTKTSGVQMGYKEVSEQQKQQLDRKQKSMAIAVKLKGEDELSAAPLLLKQNQNR